MGRRERVGLTLRTRVVWVSLAVAFTTVTGLLSLVSGPAREGIESGRSLSSVPLMRVASPAGVEAVFETRAGLAEGRWTAIVIHHSATPAENAQTLDEAHRAAGLTGLGYHFVIGNGRRMGDGEVHIGYRWLDQLYGAHVAGPAGERLNHEAIGICLVGDGDRRSFSPAQLRRLADLVTALSARLGIPADRVLLHRDVSETTSPGRAFPEAEFTAMIAGQG